MIIGDVIGEAGIQYVMQHLFSMRKSMKIDFCIANGENAATGNGISKKSAKSLYDGGVDAITLGNHAFRRLKELDEIFDGRFAVVRPANYPKGSPGSGHILIDTEITTIALINALGRIYMQPIDCPFVAVDRELEAIGDKAKIKIVDFHAEATSEKLGMLYHLDGKVSALVGTHTHVQTADERITKKGTAYLTDLGMTGPIDSILGVESEIAHDRMVSLLPKRFETAEGACMLSGVIIEIDENSGKAISIERINCAE